MNRHDFTSLLHRVPFRPFRLKLVNNESFDVPHPDLVVVNDRFMAVGKPAEKDLDGELIVYWIGLHQILYVHRIES